MSTKEECKKELQKRIRDYKAIFDYEESIHYRDTKWLDEMLLDARNQFDKCMSDAKK